MVIHNSGCDATIQALLGVDGKKINNLNISRWNETTTRMQPVSSPTVWDTSYLYDAVWRLIAYGKMKSWRHLYMLKDQQNAIDADDDDDVDVCE